jgi:hypothetical protein
MIKSVTGVLLDNGTLGVERKNLLQSVNGSLREAAHHLTSSALEKAFNKTAKKSRAPLLKKLDVLSGRL